ncbi:hypothetical protein AB0D57_23885 [Streptomyces sp. NPDC048275]|uniref:hypothetical protein n=1 Tax=Streptomyces sp. NPDC048275 TaxID=3155629 RepID=UPI0033C0A7A1
MRTTSASAPASRSGRRATALGLAGLLATAVIATTTACAGNADTAVRSTSTKTVSPKGLPSVEGKAYGYNPYAWATRSPSRIGVYGITLHGQSFSKGGQVKMVLYKDSRITGIPSWYKTTTARTVWGRPGGGFDVTTGLLDCTAYGYARNSTLMVLDVTTNTWSNKVRVSTDCGN